MKPVCKLKTFVLALIFLTFSGFSYAQEKDDLENSSSAGPAEEILQLETIVVTGAAIDDEKQEIESRKLRVHNLVDFAEILSDELVEVSMIRKSGYGNEVSVRGFRPREFQGAVGRRNPRGGLRKPKRPPSFSYQHADGAKLTLQQGPFDVTKMGALGGVRGRDHQEPKPGFHGEILGKVGSYDYYSGGVTTGGGSDKIQGLLGYNYSESDQYEDGSGDAPLESERRSARIL